MKIAQAMSARFKCISGTVWLDKAIEAVLEAAHSILPVVDDAGVYTGIISPSDFFRRCFPFHRGGPCPDLSAIFATSVALLARGCRTVSSSDTIQEAAKLMLSEKSYEFPVVDGGHVVGIISARDILSCLKNRGALDWRNRCQTHKGYQKGGVVYWTGSGAGPTNQFSGATQVAAFPP